MILCTFIGRFFYLDFCLRANTHYKENSIYLYEVLLCQNISAAEYEISVRINIVLFLKHNKFIFRSLPIFHLVEAETSTAWTGHTSCLRLTTQLLFPFWLSFLAIMQPCPMLNPKFFYKLILLYIVH